MYITYIENQMETQAPSRYGRQCTKFSTGDADSQGMKTEHLPLTGKINHHSVTIRSVLSVQSGG